MLCGASFPPYQEQDLILKVISNGNLKQGTLEYSRNIPSRMLIFIFLPYSYHMLGVPCWGFPLKAFYCHHNAHHAEAI